MQKNNQLEAIASDAAYALVQQLTLELKSLASAADWPNDIVAQLSVEWDGRNLSVVYPSDIADTVFNLEYGNESDKPNSVIRSFTYRSAPTVKEVFANRTLPQLMDLEGLFA